MSIATQHDYAAVGLPRDEEGPVFDKPWQAKAFSLIVHLHRAGLFPWAEWVRTFSEAIKAAPAQPGESVNDAYYRQWATAMENMITALHLTAPDDVAQRPRNGDWRISTRRMVSRSSWPMPAVRRRITTTRFHSAFRSR